MVVETYPGPTGVGAADYTSEAFTATVNGASVFVWAQRRPNWIPIAGTDLTFNALLEASWIKIGATEPATVVVTRRDPVTAALVPITSFEVHGTKADQVVASLQGSSLRLVVPPGAKLRIKCNGTELRTLHIMMDRPVPARPVGAVNFDTLGSITSLPDNSVVYFPNGIRRVEGPFSGSKSGALGPPELFVPRLFKLGSNVTLHFDPGAVVDGNFDTTGSNDVLIQGAGVISGRYSDWEALIFNRSYDDKITFGALWSEQDFNARTNRIQDVVLANTSGEMISSNFSRYIDCHIMQPWLGGCGGIAFYTRHPSDNLCLFDGCLFNAGDDLWNLLVQQVSVVIRNCYGVTANNSQWHFGYFAGPPTTSSVLIEDCAATFLGGPDTGLRADEPGAELLDSRFRGKAVFKFWCDGDAKVVGARSYGRFNVTARRVRVFGPLRHRLFAMGNYPYPYTQWGAFAKDQRGTTANWRFEDIVVDQVPQQKALLEGFDRLNTPCLMFFDRLRIAGRLLDAANWDEFVEMKHAYGIFVEGREVATQADICNYALARIGETARITALFPIDGSAQSDACARNFSLAFYSTLERHSWSFATRRVTPTQVTNGGNSSWPYCYEVPGDLLVLRRAIAPGITDEMRGMPAPQYAMEMNSVGDRRIYANQPIGMLIYTASISDPNKASALFVDAFAWRLAAMLAGDLLHGETAGATVQRCEQLFEVALRRAIDADVSQRVVEPVETSSWIDSRN